MANHHTGNTSVGDDKTEFQLIGEIENILTGKGVDFGDKVEPRDVLMAVLDELKYGSGNVNSTRLCDSGRTYGTERATVIASARVEYRSGGTTKRLTSEPAFINMNLTDAGFRKLTDDESQNILNAV